MWAGVDGALREGGRFTPDPEIPQWLQSSVSIFPRASQDNSFLCAPCVPSRFGKGSTVYTSPWVSAVSYPRLP